MEEKNTAFEVGDILEGTVARIDDKQVLVDTNHKTESILPISELSNLHVEHPSDVLSEGDDIRVKVLKIDEDDVIVSLKEVEAEKVWEDLEQKLEANEIFEVTVKEVVKGGLVADVGLRGFIPASLVETHFVEDFASYQDQTLRVKVVELDREQNRVILSHRAVLEAEQAHKKEEILNSLQPGQVIDGVVQRLTNFGVFVDVGGVDGLVHISELAHNHVANASDVVNEGDTLSVEVLSVDPEKERISLSHKNTIPGPWTNITDVIARGDVVEGTVKRIVDFGAFVEVKDGVEGLVHISQLANRHVDSPHEVLEVNQTVSVKVLDLDEENQRISLSIKELEKEQEAKEFQKYERSEDQSGFSLSDVIGDKLDKYKK